MFKQCMVCVWYNRFVWCANAIIISPCGTQKHDIVAINWRTPIRFMRIYGISNRVAAAASAPINRITDLCHGKSHQHPFECIIQICLSTDRHRADVEVISVKACIMVRISEESAVACIYICCDWWMNERYCCWLKVHMFKGSLNTHFIQLKLPLLEAWSWTYT